MSGTEKEGREGRLRTDMLFPVLFSVLRWSQLERRFEGDIKRGNVTEAAVKGNRGYLVLASLWVDQERPGMLNPVVVDKLREVLLLHFIDASSFSEDYQGSLSLSFN